jgi:tetrahydromethanopterin S-methyltransferase subunit G
MKRKWRDIGIKCGLVIAMILAAPLLIGFALFDDPNGRRLG